MVRHVSSPIAACAGAVFAFLASSSQALTLSSAHLAAAERLGCVLAEDALGYLSEEQFNDRFDDAVEGFGSDVVDVIYAKALGTIDGLLFGVTAGESVEVSRRLEAYSNSGRCAAATGVVANTVSL